MVHCAKCGKKIGFFQDAWDILDESKKPVKYCDECKILWHKKKDEEEKIKKEELRKKELRQQEELRKKELGQQEELLKKLRKDDLITKFSETYFVLSLSLKYENFERLATSYYTPSNGGLPEFSKWIVSDKLSKFTNVFDCDGPKWIPSEDPFAKDFLEFYKKNPDDWNALSKILRLVIKKYGDIRVKDLFNTIYDHAIAKQRETVSILCKSLGTKEKIFSYIIEYYEVFSKSVNVRQWVKELLILFLECMQKIKLVTYNSLEELRNDIIETKEARELTNFEKNLLNPEAQRYGIED